MVVKIAVTDGYLEIRWFLGSEGSIIIFCATPLRNKVVFYPFPSPFAAQQTPHQRGSNTVVLLLSSGPPPESRMCFEGRDGRCCSHPAPACQGDGSSSRAARSCQCQLLGPQREILPSCQCHHRGQSPARRAQIIQAEFFWICVWVASCWSLRSCQRCLFVTMVWGKSCAGRELGEGLKYFSFPLCWESPALPSPGLWGERDGWCAPGNSCMTTWREEFDTT